jgi:hypothetical protein
MTLAGPEEPRPPFFSRAGITALAGESSRLPVHAVHDGPRCPWPRARESTSAKAKVSSGSDASPWDMVDEWGVQSFPASDPPANW